MRRFFVVYFSVLIDASTSLSLYRNSGASKIASCPSTLFIRKHADQDQNDVLTECSQNYSLIAQDMDEISPFYRRDKRELEEPSISLTPLNDPDGLAALLAERHFARQVGDYTVVSNLDRQLKVKHGVKAYDHPPVWTRLLASPPTGFLRRQAQKQSRVMLRAFGPTGHPYQELTGEANDIDSSVWCDLSVSEIHALLQRRTQCRASGLFDEADAIILELTIHGVRVCDETLQWTIDPKLDFKGRQLASNENITLGQPSREMENTVATHRGSKLRLQYARDVLSRPLEEESTVRVKQRVEQLVQARADALVRGEVHVADSLALELYCSYAVGVNDGTRTWSVGCDFSANGTDLHMSWTPPQRPLHHCNDSNLVDKTMRTRFPGTKELLFGYRKRKFTNETGYRCSSKSLPIPEQCKDRIEDLIQNRIHMREEARFLEADAVRKELWFTYVRTSEQVFLDVRLAMCSQKRFKSLKAECWSE